MTLISSDRRLMFPHAVDSTMLAAMRSCPQKMFRTYLQHWKPKAESVHLVAGGAFAKGVEVARKAFYEGAFPAYVKDETTGQFIDKGVRLAGPEGDLEASVAAGMEALIKAYGDFECPADSAKSLERTVGALEYYFSQYPLGQDGMEPCLMANGKRAIEFSFALPLPFNHPVTGNPVLYTGRADMIAHFAGGQYTVDEKTTSQLGASWPRQWEMRAQFTGYNWAAREHGILVAGTIVRGVSILKTKYDTMQVVTYRSPAEIDRWLIQTIRDLNRLQRMWEEGWFDFALDGACAEYGGCSLLQVCKSQDPEAWLNTYFEQRVWDPLARAETTVEEFEKQWGHRST